MRSCCAVISSIFATTLCLCLYSVLYFIVEQCFWSCTSAVEKQPKTCQEKVPVRFETSENRGTPYFCCFQSVVLVENFICTLKKMLFNLEIFKYLRFFYCQTYLQSCNQFILSLQKAGISLSKAWIYFWGSLRVSWSWCTQLSVLGVSLLINPQNWLVLTTTSPPFPRNSVSELVTEADCQVFESPSGLSWLLGLHVNVGGGYVGFHVCVCVLTMCVLHAILVWS